jgi:hypothetical protein
MFGLPSVSEQVGASPSGAVQRTVRADTVDQSMLAGGFGRWSFVSVLVSNAFSKASPGRVERELTVPLRWCCRSGPEHRLVFGRVFLARERVEGFTLDESPITLQQCGV